MAVKIGPQQQDTQYPSNSVPEILKESDKTARDVSALDHPKKIDFSKSYEPQATKRNLSIFKRVISILKRFFLLGVDRKESKFKMPPQEMESWMTRLYQGDRANTPVMSCSMMGSHDAASYCLNKPRLITPLGVTQSADLTQQLKAGVRYLDIRICMDSQGQYIVHHGIIKGLSSETEVIQPLNEFLKNHPNEAVVVKLQFGGMAKEQVHTYLEKEFYPSLETFMQPNHDKSGNFIKPGEVTFNDINESKRNLMVTVSDDSMAQKFTQEEFGDNIWYHKENTHDFSWSNTPVAKEMFQFNEKKIDEYLCEGDEHKNKLHILQLQTNVKPNRIFSGGLRSMKSMAKRVNKKIPDVLVGWYKNKKFKPNIIMQDYIGHFGYDKALLTSMAFNSMHLSESELLSTFPNSYEEILTIRKELQET